MKLIPGPRATRWSPLARLALILVAAIAVLVATASPPADAAGPARKSRNQQIQRAPVTLDQEQDLAGGRRPGGKVRLQASARQRLQEPANLKRADLDNARSRAFDNSRVKQAIDPDMKILVISADGNEPDFPAIKAFLDQIGIPYDTFMANSTPMTASVLSDGVAHGYYDGIILASGSLIYYDAATGTYPSAFTADEWQILWTYEAQYKVRQVTSFTAPGFANPDPYGLTYAGEADTTTSPLTATLTTAGQQVFSYLNASSPITVKNAWAYFGTNPDAATTPLLVTPQGYVLASIHAYPDGRQNLAVTVANNPYLVHSMLLSYGTINWVTKGVFLGERHVNIGPQIDDLFIDDSVWDPTTKTDTSGLTYRTNAADYNAAINWQTALHNLSPLLATLRLEWAFVGEGAVGDIYTPDDLTPAVIANSAPFNFINHTYSHQDLDYVDPDIGNYTPVTYAQVLSQLQLNDAAVTSTLHFANYAKNAMIQPNISGLNSPQSLQAMKDFGISYVISDTSRPGWNNPSPNAGFFSSYQSSILIIPRHPSNLFYNLITPQQWVSEYNCYYSLVSGTCVSTTGQHWQIWDHDFTYAEIIDHESDNLLGYMLRWDLDPWMFHTPNMGTYDGVHSLMGDLLDATMAKYTAVYNLPVRSMALREIGPKMADRMAYNASGVKASVACPVTGTGTMTITTVNPATIPVTGLNYGTNVEVYGGQTISYITLAANQTLAIPAPAAACTPDPSQADLSITNTDGVTNVAPGTVVTYTVVASNAGPAPVNGAVVADTLPAGFTGATWTCVASAGASCGAASGTGNLSTFVNLPVNGTATFAVRVTVVASPPGTSLANTATVAAPAGTSDPTPANNTATDSDAIVFTLTLRDNFNRANANRLGTNWAQAITNSAAAIQVNTNQASAVQSGTAIWNASGSTFGSRQAAAFTFANAPVSNATTPPSLLLKATSGTTTSPARYIRVAYVSNQVVVSTTTNSGSTLTTRGTFAATFVSGDTLTAVAFPNGSVAVYKTSGANTTLLGAVVIPTSGTGAWTYGTGGGRIGLQLPATSRVDDFRGGTVP